jgi:rare lipoprotein A (peptidoglycan hydrolase)
VFFFFFVSRHKVENGTCLYSNSSYNKNASDTAFDTFGVHAAHALLPPYTKVQVTYNNKTIDVTINGFTNTTNGTLLNLSREAADTLGIKEGELVSCSVGVYEPETNYSHIKRIIGLTASFFTVVLVVMYML